MSGQVVRISPRARYDAGQSSPYHQAPPASRAADAEVSAAGQRLRDWARDLADNSAIVAAVLSSRVSNAIGAGLSYEPLVRDRRGELIPEINDAIRRIHERWSRSVDVTGELSRQELERLMWRGWDIDGESFARRVPLRFDRDPRSLTYRLQLIESDLVPLWLTQQMDDVYIVNGVAKDQWGRPVRYYVAPRDRDVAVSGNRLTTNPRNMESVPARDMWHFKRASRPDQTRGLSLLTQVIFRVSDISRYQEAHRLAARASADLFASINRATDMDESLVFDSVQTESGETERKPSRHQFDFERLMIMDGLMPGESVNFHKPEHPNQNAVEFVQQELRQIAAACDVGFSQIAQVFDSSYAAQRLEVVDTWRKVERDRAKFVSDFARSALYEQVVEAAITARMLPARAMRRADPDTLLEARIDGPQMPVIDPIKDRQAYELDQANGWDSRPGIIRRMGRRPGEVDAEIEQDDWQPISSPSAASDEVPDPPAGAEGAETGPDNEEADQ